MTKNTLDWTNIITIGSVHAFGLFAILYMAFVHFSWWTVLAGVLWMVLCSLSITAGYHRLFSHRSYEACAPLRLLYLLFGAASVQNSALKWSHDHRIHHRNTDHDDDPYNINRGFWWAHIGWVLFKDRNRVQPEAVHDLYSDPLVRFQHRHYVLLAVLVGAVIPLSLGLVWGDPLGAFLVAGMLRLMIQWHMTFSVNSVAHMIGVQPYSTATSARDSLVTAMITLGEGYHNFHHRFPTDYRNGARWFHFDPTKWFVWSMSKVGLTSRLKRIPRDTIQRARRRLAACGESALEASRRHRNRGRGTSPKA